VAGVPFTASHLMAVLPLVCWLDAPYPPDRHHLT